MEGNKSTFNGIIWLDGSRYYIFRAGEENMGLKKTSYDKLSDNWKKWITDRNVVKDAVIQDSNQINNSRQLTGEFALSTHWVANTPHPCISSRLLYLPSLQNGKPQE